MEICSSSSLDSDLVLNLKSNVKGTQSLYLLYFILGSVKSVMYVFDLMVQQFKNHNSGVSTFFPLRLSR